MARFTRGNKRKTSERAMVYVGTPMDLDTKVCGRMTREKARVSSRIKVGKSQKEHGRKMR